jgi:hypothetical protein
LRHPKPGNFHFIPLKEFFTMALEKDFIQKAYIAFFNRPADVTGLNNWLAYGGAEQDLLNAFASSAEYTNLFVGQDTKQIVYTIYNNLLNRDPDISGLNNWVSNINAGVVTVASLAYDIITTVEATAATTGAGDKKTLDAKLNVANAFTTYLENNTDASKVYEEKGDVAAPIVKNWFKTIKVGGDNEAEVIGQINSTGDDLVAKANPGTPTDPGSTIWLGNDGKDPTISGTDGNNKFIAGVDQIDDNTRVDGKGGTDTLEIDIRDNLSIAPTVRNVEEVKVRVQHATEHTGEDNNITSDATLDADRFTGVNRWENFHSRGDLQVEDVKILDSEITKDITVAFVESDPGHVDYALYFDPSSLRNKTAVSGTLVATVVDLGSLDVGKGPLVNAVYNQLTLKIDGVIQSIQFRAINSPTATYEDLGDSIRDGIAANPALSQYNLKVDVVNESIPLLDENGNPNGKYAPGYITINTVGHTLEVGTWDVVNGSIPNNTLLGTLQKVGNDVSTDLVTSTIELDYVGRGERGGDLVIGSLSTGVSDTSTGVQQFDITVKRDSSLEVISSTNNSLQEVNIKNSGTYKHLGAFERDSGNAREGDLVVKGTSDITTIIERTLGVGKSGPFEIRGDLCDQNYIDGGTNAQLNGYGFTDVRKINASSFKGQLDLSAILTANVVGKYLNLVDKAPSTANIDNVHFTYDLGTNNDILDVAISSQNLAAAGTTTREDFLFNITGNAGDDSINTAIYQEDPTTDGVKGWGFQQDSEPDDPVINLEDNLALALPSEYWASGAIESRAHWYQNNKENANLTINAGSGNDTIRTLGSGDWKVILGSGNDTYYADNTGSKAAWVFNTTNQNDDVWTNDRNLDGVFSWNPKTQKYDIINNNASGLKSDSNDDHILVNDNRVGGTNDYQPGETAGLYGLKLRVAYKDVSVSSNVLPDAGNPSVTDIGRAQYDAGSGVYFSQVIDVPTATDKKFVVTDLNINQAIKLAINNDPVLSKLLVAKDGPANTLVVEALSDGHHVDVHDLQIEFAIPTVATDVDSWGKAIGAIGWDAADLAAARNTAFNELLGHGTAANTVDGSSVSDLNNYGPNAGAGYTDWHTSNKSTDVGDYDAAFATTNSGGIAKRSGVNSLHISDNVVLVDGSSSDHDVVVLSTGQHSNDTIKWEGFDNGTITVANFDGTELLGGTIGSTVYTLNFGAIPSVNTPPGVGTDPVDSWPEASGSGKKITVTIPGITSADGVGVLVGATAADTAVALKNEIDKIIADAPAGSPLKDLAVAVNPLNDKILTITGPAGFSYSGGPIQIRDGDGPAQNPTNITGLTSTSLTALQEASTYVPASSLLLGQDALDFTAYGARWLGAATLDNKGYVDASTGWDVVNDYLGAKFEDISSTANTGLGHVLTDPNALYVWGDLQLKANDKYITLTRVHSEGAKASTSNPDWNTVYKIELWTVVGTHADAYRETLVNGDTKDTAQTIGYVDLGKEIDGTATNDVNSVLDNIDYIV